MLEFCSVLYPDSPAELLTLNLYKVPLLSVICFTPLYIFSVYSFIYILLPRYLQKKRYGAFIIAAFIIALCNFIAGIFLSILFYKVTGIDLYLTGTIKSLAPFRSSIYQGIILAFLSTGGMVTAIKLGKNWYLQQKENMRLTRLKRDMEIKLLKANLQPAFLFQSLNVLHRKIICYESDAPAMVLQLSELLSRILYDSDGEFIPLKQELEMAYRLIHIKKLDKKTNLTINISVYGDDDKKYISPLLIFSYLQTVLNEAEINKAKNNVLDIILNISDKLIFHLSEYPELCTEFDLYDEYFIGGILKNATAENIILDTI